MGRNARRRKAAKLVTAWHRKTEHPARPQHRYVDPQGACVPRAERRRVRYRPTAQEPKDTGRKSPGGLMHSIRRRLGRKERT